MALSFSKVTPENPENQGREFVYVAVCTWGFVHGYLLQCDVYSSPF